MNTECEISRFTVSRPKPIATYPEDSLVADARAGLTPAQMVDRRLVALFAQRAVAQRSPAFAVSRRPALARHE